jgi:hypothetical protein
MATVQNIIDSARYDLVDFVDGVGLGIEFDDAELLNYLNRMVGILDQTLSSLESDLVVGVDHTLTTTANLDYIDLSSMNSGLWSDVRSVYREQNLLDKVSIAYMYYTRRYRQSVLDSGDAIASGDYIMIVTQNTLDFTTLGAGDNNSGTYFTATSAGTLGAGDYAFKFSSGLPTIWALEGDKILLPQVPGAVKQITVYYDKKTATLTLSSNMPYSDRFNEFLREMLVMCAKAKKEGSLERSDAALEMAFRKRAMQEEISRGFIPKPYVLEF